MWNNAKIIMLATKGSANLELKGYISQLFHHNVDRTRDGNQHLYVITDDKIERNDWFYHKTLDKIQQWLGEGKFPFETNCFKIIATTDKLLKSEWVYKTNILPQIATSFLEHFAREYNSGNIIADVEIEFEAIPNELDNPLTNPLGLEDFDGSEWELKINNDNTVNIKNHQIA